MNLTTSISGSTVNVSGLHSPQEAAVLANMIKNTMSFFSFDNFHKLSLGDCNHYKKDTAITREGADKARSLGWSVIGL